jgi:hypothetical protein
LLFRCLLCALLFEALLLVLQLGLCFCTHSRRVGCLLFRSGGLLGQLCLVLQPFCFPMRLQLGLFCVCLRFPLLLLLLQDGSGLLFFQAGLGCGEAPFGYFGLQVGGLLS